MKVGFIGLGKLGLPVAVAIEASGKHHVIGYDIDPERMCLQANYLENGLSGDFAEDLKSSGVRFGEMREVVDHAEILFVAVQTPHDSRYEGVTPLPKQRQDFDYSWLVSCIREIETYCRKPTLVVVISTCLSGTIRERVLPHCNKYMRVVYNPFFIAMGTVVENFLNPEFVLMGGRAEDCAELSHFYSTLVDAPMRSMSIESAELTKCAYNTFISMKLAFVNTLLEVAEKSAGIDVDDVTEALKCASDRLISPRYLSAGMGDGGGCHPRDNIAMSWLARELDLEFDLFEAVMLQREGQARWLASLMKGWDLPKCILGFTFKPETNITTGSHALLVDEYLDDAYLWDPTLPALERPDHAPHVYLIGMNHLELAEFPFPMGSVVIDPWRMIPDQEGVKVIRLGEFRG